jgi:hypothetical protein
MAFSWQTSNGLGSSAAPRKMRVWISQQQQGVRPGGRISTMAHPLAKAALRAVLSRSRHLALSHDTGLTTLLRRAYSPSAYLLRSTTIELHCVYVSYSFKTGRLDCRLGIWGLVYHGLSTAPPRHPDPPRASCAPTEFTLHQQTLIAPRSRDPESPAFLPEQLHVPALAEDDPDSQARELGHVRRSKAGHPLRLGESERNIPGSVGSCPTHIHVKPAWIRLR